MKTQLTRDRKEPTPVVKLGASGQMVIPKKLSTALGLRGGDYLNVELYRGNRLLVTPKVLVDRHPEIDRRLAEAEEDVRAGRMSGPFDTIDELKRHLDSVKL
ncbi:AbrB/MazE/SpoVT family DNA-binding domain-containing protein [Candidatus Kaiserbacteria bacterium]|nr:AbrB/MazE/SpoVT family DNA-binding domain-containing protein [Candidatus Kaiserbacteria bacterium]